jgi:Abnormal spindle-like microcephaly-assoc'd, ASPM-SPD-2-Hydin
MFRAGTAVWTLTLFGLTIATFAFAKDTSKTIETFPSGFAVSQRVSDLPIELSVEVGEQIHEPGPGPLRLRGAASAAVPEEDSVLQKEASPLVSAAGGASFNGISSPGYVPSDSNLAVGPNEIVEVVNVQFAVYSKTGATLAGPTNIQHVFAPLGGVCANTYGDPVVLYDRVADRWVLSYIGTNTAGSVGAECVAVSKTNNPAGAYYLYGYSFGANLNDYPKLSTWATATNSAYLATYNIFQNFLSYSGADLCALDRTKMLAGNASAAQICKKTPNSEFGYLPGDMDGPTPPVDGAPAPFISWYNNSPGQLYLRTLKVNFAAGTATLSSPTVINTANSSLACGNGGQCVPQHGTTQTLDSLGDRLMYRFAIRHFPDHDRAVVNHAVGTGGHVAVRWYELYDPAGSVTLHQQGTFAPDSTYRWMASLAEDQVGNIGMGYSASSSSINPGIRFTGHAPSDPAGTMESESTLVQGAGSQVGSYAYRWGDYTAMQVDPSDDCTFWFVDQYQKVNGTFDWATNISAFAFNSCSGSTGSPAVSLSPGTLTYSKRSVGTTGCCQTVTLTNSGSSALNISSITTTGDFGTKTVAASCGSAVAAGASCIVKVNFTPTQTGTRTGSLLFKDDAPGSPQSVALTGTGQ